MVDGDAFIRFDEDFDEPEHTSVATLEWEHDDTMDCLHQALFDCKEAWIQGWEVDRHNWHYNHPIALGRRCREYNSGVYAMHYALHFDGSDVMDLSVEVSVWGRRGWEVH